MGRQQRTIISPWSAVAIVSSIGFICYSIGVSNSCTTSQWLRDSIPQYNDIPLTHISNATMSSAAQSISKQHLVDTNDRRSIPRTNLPYNCGVIFFYHIPSTSGASINQWFRKYQKAQFGNISYYQYWSLETLKDGTFPIDPEKHEMKFANGMSDYVQNLQPNEWKIAHSHLLSTYLNESEDLLYKWRADVEAQGCEMINTVMLRDGLNHAMSLYKIIEQKNTNRTEWIKYLHSPTGTGLWSTVLDFFLYNTHGLRNQSFYPAIGGRNPFSLTKETKVKRAMEILHKYFDIVTLTGDHTNFISTIQKWTGLTSKNKYQKGNVHKKTIDFTKKEIENLYRLLEMNGDIDFVDQVKMEYYDYLGYLNN